MFSVTDTVEIGTNQLKVKGCKTFHANSNQKRTGVGYIIIKQNGFKIKKVTSDKSESFILIKLLIYKGGPQRPELSSGGMLGNALPGTVNPHG